MSTAADPEVWDAPREAREERTAELADLLRRSSDEVEQTDLRRRLVEANLPAADAVSARYRGRGIAEDDLRQVARLALVRAAQRYEPGDDADFMAFAVPTMRGEVRRYFRDHGWMVRPTRRIQELQAQLRTSGSAAVSGLGHEDALGRSELELVAQRLGVTEQDVGEALSASGCFSPTSLDAPATAHPDGDPLGHVIPDAATPHGPAEARLVLGPVLRHLAPRDAQIVVWRFWDDLTQREIAERLGVTQMQVSRLLARILGELRDAVGALEPS